MFKGILNKLKNCPSLKIIFALANAIVGSLILLIPGSFLKSGFWLSLIIMTIIGICFNLKELNKYI